MNLLSARSRIAIGLACLLVSVLCTAMMIGIMPDARKAVMDGRATLCETIAMSSSDYISRGELRRLEYLLRAVVTRNRDILSAGVRRSDGQLVATVGDHLQHWDRQKTERSTDSQVLVPIRSGEEKWGSVELCFRPILKSGWAGWFQSPWVRLTGFVTGCSYLLFLYYLRKMLAHLDPSQTVPRRVRSALDSLAEGLLVIDKDQRVVLANQSFASWVGKNPQKLIGQSAAKLNWVKNEQGESLESYPWVEAIRLEAPQAGVMLGLRDADGTVRVLMANASPVLGHDGKYRGVLVSFDDVTQLEETKRDLSVAKRAAEEANHAKSEFLARMSHEIRTPMNAILGYTDVLRRGFDESSENRQEYLDTIHGSGEHLLALINDILDLSKVESGQMELELQRCSPHQLVSQVVALLRSKADEKGIGLECRFEGPLPETILTDSVRLRQTVMNLAGNAIKFTEKGGVTLAVRLAERASGQAESQAKQQLLIDVIDTGIGIPPAAQKRIFEPFAQADTSVTRKFGGTGLGLAISKQLAEAMGGGITISSEPGKGSTFTVAIETGPLNDIPFVDAETALAAAGEIKTEKKEVMQLPPARILVADDGESNRKLIQLVLGRAGVKVVAVENGKQAMEQALDSFFDIILMDMQMPVMDGYTASTKLRQAGYERPIIALTAQAMRGDEERCRAAGCSGFLTKPIKIDLLLSTLDNELRAGSDADLSPSRPTADGETREAAGDQSGADDQMLPSEDESNRVDAEIREALNDLTATSQSALPSTAKPPSDRIPSPSPRVSKEPVLSSFPLDDPEFLDIATSYRDRLWEQIAAMRTAAAEADDSELASLAHWLKGSGGTAGFDAFTEPALELEAAAKQQQRDRYASLIDVIADLAERIQLTSEVPAAGRETTILPAASHTDLAPAGPIRCSFPLDDPDFREIAEGYRHRLCEQLATMRQAIAEHDFEALAGLAHWLKGSGGTAGFDAFTEPARELESAAKQQLSEHCSQLIAQLTEMAHRIDLESTGPPSVGAAPLSPPTPSTHRVAREPLISSLPIEDPDFREIVVDFVARLHEQLDAMEQAYRSADYQELASLAHWLKGSGGTAGFDAFTATARSLEQAARHQDQGRAAADIKELRALTELIVVPAPSL